MTERIDCGDGSDLEPVGPGFDWPDDDLDAKAQRVIAGVRGAAREFIEAIAIFDEDVTIIDDEPDTSKGRKI